MLCRTCGASLPEGRTVEFCPHCCFGSALGLGAAGGEAGETVEGYERLHELGRGGMVSALASETSIGWWRSS
jgi:hypothetical protein